MARNIFDTHTHYTDRRFDPDREALLASLPGQGVAFVLNCGSNLRDSKQGLALAQQYPYIYAACGLHPHEAKDFDKHGIGELRLLLHHPKCVAVGEIGLDYHYDFSPRDLQKDCFRRQLELAWEMNLPVIVHDREAHEDTLRILQEFKPRGVMHCFTGSVEFAREILTLGMYISFGGAVTFKNAKKPVEVAAYIPLDRLLLETDAPYMTPVPHRGKRCDSTHIGLIAEKIAALRNMDAQELIDICNQNGQKLFINEKAE